VTIRFVPCHYKTQYRDVAHHFTEIVEAAAAGSIVVMEGAAGTTGALGGEMNALTAIRAGHAGQVSDGPVRDVDGLRATGFPVFHKPTPIAATMETYVGTGIVAGRNEYLNCAGALVRPGDYIVGGNDGLVVVPTERVDEIIDAALDMQELEKQLRESVLAGKKWSEIYKTTHAAKYGVD
jgi:3-hexulose-6-phosphate synthase/6-phospho-3-hexuloisomerase